MKSGTLPSVRPEPLDKLGINFGATRRSRGITPSEAGAACAGISLRSMKCLDFARHERVGTVVRI